MYFLLRSRSAVLFFASAFRRLRHSSIYSFTFLVLHVVEKRTLLLRPSIMTQNVFTDGPNFYA